VKPAGTEHPSDFGGERFELGEGEGHTEEHVREASVETLIVEREPLAHVERPCADEVTEPALSRLAADRLDRARCVVEDVDVEAATSEEEAVSALAATELEQAAYTLAHEQGRRLLRRLARLGAEAVAALLERPLPLRPLLVKRRPLAHPSLAVASQHASLTWLIAVSALDPAVASVETRS
jgi:hypothetical protein